jgi:prephenate dehydrogenase
MESHFTICIVGLGLMGGSLAMAFRQAPALGQSAGWPNARIIGVNRGEAALSAALAAGAIDAGTTNLAEGVAAADVIVLSTPVRTILRLLPQVGEHAKPGALVLDMGSSKTTICAALDALPAHLEPVGGHPLCGKETAGFAAADATLYMGRPFVLCPLPRTSEAALARAMGLVQAIGARPLVADPATHDKAVAAISHLPYTVAVSLVNAVAAGGDDLAWTLAAGGFRDTSRVAASDVDMMFDTLLTNRDAVLGWIDAFAGQLTRLRDALAAGDEDALAALLRAAQQRRSGWQYQGAAEAR